MLRRTLCNSHRGAHRRPFLLRDTSFKKLRERNVSDRTGLRGTDRLLQYGKIDSRNSDHAFPLLSHTDFGNQDHIANTHWLQLAQYMPKRTKGSPPWFRGADTYSVLYSEQGRYEYQRYLMIARMPSEFRGHFMRFLGFINDVEKQQQGPPDGPAKALPQEVLHWLLRMIVENFNPQHVHYQAAMAVLTHCKEHDMAMDVWKIMERQQTWPDDKLVVQYFDLLAKAKEKTHAIQCWNRYCTEKRFLQDGEVDPKPISRVPFALNRDETLYLPKWKKHFDHDPNLDVTDLNRFNTTRDIYRAMAGVMLACKDVDMFEKYLGELESKLMNTPSPVAEPPNPILTPRPTWGPHIAQDSLKRSPWRLKDSEIKSAHGPNSSAVEMLHRRFQSNKQFFLTSLSFFVDILTESPSSSERGAGASYSTEEALKHVEKLLERAFDTLGKGVATLDTDLLFSSALRAYRTLGALSPQQLKEKGEELLRKKGNGSERFHPSLYLEILRGFTQPANANEAKSSVRLLHHLMAEMASSPSFRWSLDIHLAVMKVMVNCGTMKANDYFAKNVLRQFRWNSDFCEVLYAEYRRQKDVEHWAELTKRLLVWTARYDVFLSERFKRLVEEDYDTIKVQVRTIRELAIFRYRDMEEKRLAATPTSQLPNPFADYVSHALPFPDRDTGTADQFGDLGQWRAPETGAPTAPMPGRLSAERVHKGRLAPPLYGEYQKGFYGQWAERKGPSGLPKLPAPWDRKYAEYARGTNPSYDQVYAGPHPEIFPDRYNFRKITRWDFKSIEKQSKYDFAFPY